MLSEIVEILIFATGIITFLCLFIRIISYLFLTSIDDYLYSYFSYDYQIGCWLIYDKNVKPAYEWIKKLSNLLLVSGIRLFLIDIVLILIKAILVNK